ncbi:MAG: hypothetical protein NTV34_14610, partial [Proteobacteria bacterium]|nr:hypothetical protein [Pseudomonadota bacterium]
MIRSHALDPDARSLGFRVSNITALLKSLAPIGKRLTPMMAIAAQGALFSLGTVLFGPTLFGVVIGSLLLATWGFIQPIALTTLVYGATLGPERVKVILQYYSKMLESFLSIEPSNLLHIVVGALMLKLLLSLLLALHAWRWPAKNILSLQSRLIAFAPHHKKPLPNAGFFSIVVGTFRDTLRPVFIGPLMMTGAFYWFAEHQWASVLWGTMRPFAVGYLIMMALRMIPWDRVALKMQERNPAFSEALARLVPQPPTDAP